MRGCLEQRFTRIIMYANRTSKGLQAKPDPPPGPLFLRWLQLVAEYEYLHLTTYPRVALDTIWQNFTNCHIDSCMLVGLLLAGPLPYGITALAHALFPAAAAYSAPHGAVTTKFACK